MSKLLTSTYVLVAVAAATLAPRMALATPDFPAAMATDLGVACAPACTVCHTTINGGAGTVTQPFGRQLQIYGLVKYDQASLASALNQMTTNKIDSNCNGMIDTDELKNNCTDPNINVQCDGGTSALGDVVIYGCGTSPSGPGSAAAAIAALLIGGVAARRLRRRA